MSNGPNTNKSIRNILVIILFIIIIYIMKVLAVIIIPLVLAFLLAVVFQPLIIFLRKLKIPRIIILPFVSILSLGIVFGIGLIFVESITQIVDNQAHIVNKFNILVDNILTWLDSQGFKIDYDLIYEQITSFFNLTWLTGAAGNLVKELGSFAGSFLMFAIYYILILSGMSNYKTYLSYVQGDIKNFDIVKEYENIQRSIYSYFSIKTLVSVLTGLMAYGLCTFFNVPFPIFWGFITFLLNYIPSIGSTVATIFPTIMAIIEFGELKPVLAFAILLSMVQFIMGNIIEPIVMGSRLRLNTLTVIFGLVFWGYIWGISGMILSVPLIVVLKIVLERFPTFSFFGRILGYPDKKSKIIEMIEKEQNSEEK